MFFKLWTFSRKMQHPSKIWPYLNTTGLRIGLDGLDCVKMDMMGILPVTLDGVVALVVLKDMTN